MLKTVLLYDALPSATTAELHRNSKVFRLPSNTASLEFSNGWELDPDFSVGFLGLVGGDVGFGVLAAGEGLFVALAGLGEAPEVGLAD